MTEADRQPVSAEQPAGEGVPGAGIGPPAVDIGLTPPSRLPRGLSAFSHRNFRLFWMGQLVSLAGTWMQQVGQAWLVLQLTDDPLALGFVAAAQFGPVLVFGLFAGLLADALPKRALLLGTQVAAMVLAAILGLLVASGQVQVWHVYLLALALGVVNSFDMPVRQAFVVEMVGREDIGNAVALNSAVFTGTRVVGPAIAGLLIAAVGLAPLFFINAVTYLAVIAGLLLMRVEELVAPAERAVMQRNARIVLGQLGEGIGYVRHSAPILLSISVLGVVATVALNFQVLIPVLARDVLGGQADVFGFLMAASGVGSLISALSIAFGQRPTLRLLLVGAAAVGVAMIGLGVSRFVPLSLLLMVLAGWGTIAMAATTNTIIQLEVPDVLRGRVMAVYTTVFAGSVPLGGLFAGGVAAAAGVPMALALGGALALVTVGVAAMRLPGAGRPRLATALRR
ncbi:MAG TPA: MFS transporter [Candidatus Limnocylindria bacterium]|nr:MFS transporter [Candidatus Limnocylindria bacterium]